MGSAMILKALNGSSNWPRSPSGLGPPIGPHSANPSPIGKAGPPEASPPQKVSKLPPIRALVMRALPAEKSCWEARRSSAAWPLEPSLPGSSFAHRVPPESCKGHVHRGDASAFGSRALEGRWDGLGPFGPGPTWKSSPPEETTPPSPRPRGPHDSPRVVAIVVPQPGSCSHGSHVSGR